MHPADALEIRGFKRPDGVVDRGAWRAPLSQRWVHNPPPQFSGRPQTGATGKPRATRNSRRKLTSSPDIEVIALLSSARARAAVGSQP
jgi:hypothetical protein